MRINAWGIGIYQIMVEATSQTFEQYLPVPPLGGLIGPSIKDIQNYCPAQKVVDVCQVDKGSGKGKGTLSMFTLIKYGGACSGGASIKSPLCTSFVFYETGMLLWYSLIYGPVGPGVGKYIQ